MDIVSSDREIRRYVTAWGGQWLSSEAFIEELGSMGILHSGQNRPVSRKTAAGQVKNGSRPLSDAEVARWLLLFGKDK